MVFLPTKQAGRTGLAVTLALTYLVLGDVFVWSAIPFAVARDPAGIRLTPWGRRPRG